MTDCFLQCKDLINDFLKENNLYSFVDFDFNELNDIKKFGVRSKYRCYTSDKHSDSSRLARLIYYIIWGNHEYNKSKEWLPLLDDADFSFYCGKEKYGGETIFSNSIPCIGNFMILPKGKADNGATTLNRYKQSCYKDNFFKFMNKMKNIYEKYIEPDVNKKIFPTDISYPLWQQIIDNNSFYFNQINTFEKFVKINMLEGWKTIKNEEIFIKNRAERICAILKERLQP